MNWKRMQQSLGDVIIWFLVDLNYTVKRMIIDHCWFGVSFCLFFCLAGWLRHVDQLNIQISLISRTRFRSRFEQNSFETKERKGSVVRELEKTTHNMQKYVSKWNVNKANGCEIFTHWAIILMILVWNWFIFFWLAKGAAIKTIPI